MSTENSSKYSICLWRKLIWIIYVEGVQAFDNKTRSSIMTYTELQWKLIDVNIQR